MMNDQHMKPFGFTVEELALEMKARAFSIPQIIWEVEIPPQLVELLRHIRMLSHSSQLPPPNPALSFMSTPALLRLLWLSIKAIALDIRRGIWNGKDDRKDMYEITNEQVRKNALSTAAVCRKKDLHDNGSGNWKLRVKQYGDMLNLCKSELFYDQQAAAGSMCTGVLVDKDVVLTAAHFLHDTHVKDLRFIFGYAAVNPTKVITQFPAENIYRGGEVLHRGKDSSNPGAKGSDWALVKLEREVKGQEIVTLSQETIFTGQPIYIMGFPMGLPLKYSPGNVVQDIQTGHFMAHVDVFMGNSGSPVFSAEDHLLLGLLTRTDAKDFKWTVDGLSAVKFPDKDIASYGACCIPASVFYKTLHEKGGHFENQPR